MLVRFHLQLTFNVSTGSRRAVHVSRLLLANGDDFCLDRERGAGGIVLLALLLVPALVLALLASRLLRRRERGVFPDSALSCRAFTCCNRHGRRCCCRLCRLFLLTYAATPLYTQVHALHTRAYYDTLLVWGAVGALIESLCGGGTAAEVSLPALQVDEDAAAAAAACCCFLLRVFSISRGVSSHIGARPYTGAYACTHAVRRAPTDRQAD